MNDAALMALKPRFAESILNGQKTIELRRVRARFRPGQRVLVYASSPMKELQGEFVVSSVRYGTPATLWPSVSGKAGVTFAEFVEYFAGAAIACAVEVVQAVRWREPVSLGALRGAVENFVVPQSYCFLSAEQARDIELARVAPQLPIAAIQARLPKAVNQRAIVGLRQAHSTSLVQIENM